MKKVCLSFLLLFNILYTMDDLNKQKSKRIKEKLHDSRDGRRPGERIEIERINSQEEYQRRKNEKTKERRGGKLSNSV